MVYEPQKRAERVYKAKLKAKGFKDCHIWLNDQQWQVVKTFAQCVRKIKKLKYIVGFDVSDDLLEYKIILDENILNGGMLSQEEEDAILQSQV